MASAISPSSRKRKADEWEWESFPEEDPTVDENIALAKYYGTCSSTSSLSSASSSLFLPNVSFQLLDLRYLNVAECLRSDFSA